MDCGGNAEKTGSTFYLDTTFVYEAIINYLKENKDLKKGIRILLLGAALLLPFASHAFADSGSPYVQQAADGQTVTLTYTSGSAKMGDNKISIHITDAQGKPVASAKVSIVADMYPEASGSSSGGGMDMGGSSSPAATKYADTPMQTMKADMMAGQISGDYEGDLTLDEAGHWMITVNSTVNQQTTSVEFTEDIAKSGPNWAVLSIFFGAIVAIIGVAAITMKKRAKVPVTEGN